MSRGVVMGGLYSYNAADATHALCLKLYAPCRDGLLHTSHVRCTRWVSST